ncbi:hypothetical protein SHK09_03480 [Polaribacter sp. PL03]|uniref:hypothetical protein n=1 Tax=Polaribacter sp. PL03 TaxID=3088353 RepID=UPI0029D2C3CD|nr:hypothetical protein [Polaribacter sp. PL03]MDX6745842.1 hypothetical protein [Polaribacter sp. PL03]
MNNKYKKLVASIVLDVIGLIPVPFLDVIWAPLSGYIMTKMYKGKEGKVAGIVSFLEEILPLDIIPTFTIMWVYSYVINKRKNEELIEN